MKWSGQIVFRWNETGFDWKPFGNAKIFRGFQFYFGWLWFCCNVTVYKK